MTRVSEKFIKNLQGKQFVLYSGLLELAHQDGLSHSNTEILQYPNDTNKQTCVVKAVVITKKGTFSGIGDASPASVPNKNIAVHSIRMAETRAMARALRVATNVEMTAFEELGSDLIIDDYQVPKQSKPEPKKEPTELEIALDRLKSAAKNVGMESQNLADYLKKYYNVTWKGLDANTANKVASAIENSTVITGA